MKTIINAAAAAALLLALAPAAVTAAHADGITLKRGGTSTERTSRNRAGEEPADEEPADTSDDGNVADPDDEAGSGWSWGGGTEDDDEPSVRDDDARQTIVLSREVSRHHRRHRHRHGERSRTLWILNW